MTVPVNAAELFDQLEAAFLSQRGYLGPEPRAIQRSFVCAGVHFELEFADPMLEPLLLRALSHHQSPTERTAEAIKISVFSSSQPKLHPSLDRLIDGLWMRRGEVQGIVDERFLLSVHGHGGVISAFDKREQRAICWYQNSQQVPDYIRAAPLLHLLHLSLARSGIQLLHAGGVGRNGRGFLLAGPGGSGKSTTCAACLLHGLDYLGDDYVAFGAEEAPLAHSVFSTTKLFLRDLHRTPGLSQLAAEDALASDEKALIFLAEGFIGQLVPMMKISGLLLPTISGAKKTKIKSVSSADALKSLVPSTIFQLPHAGAEAFHRMARLTRQVPAYAVDLGSDTREVACVIEDFLGRQS